MFASYLPELALVYHRTREMSVLVIGVCISGLVRALKISTRLIAAILHHFEACGGAEAQLASPLGPRQPRRI